MVPEQNSDLDALKRIARRRVVRLIARVALFGVIGFLIGLIPFVCIIWFNGLKGADAEIFWHVGPVVGLLMMMFTVLFAVRILFPRESASDHDEGEQKIKSLMLDQAIGLVAGPFGSIFNAIRWLGTKDFKKQRPGRSSRALVGAMFMGIVGCIVAAMLIHFDKKSSNVFLVNLGICLLASAGAGLIGAILGALSDSW